MWLTIDPTASVLCPVWILAHALANWATLLPVTVKDCSIWQSLYSFTMKFPLRPITFVALTILPNIQTYFKQSFMKIIELPTLSMRFVFKILASIFRAVHVDPLSEPVPLAIFEHSIIYITIRPGKFSLSVGYAIHKFPLILESPIQRDDFGH
jgi:hypothetical protein